MRQVSEHSGSIQNNLGPTAHLPWCHPRLPSLLSELVSLPWHAWLPGALCLCLPALSLASSAHGVSQNPLPFPSPSVHTMLIAP